MPGVFSLSPSVEVAMIIFQKVTSTEICTNIPYALRKNPGQRKIKLSGE
jgi:hypothetical protein